MTEQRVRRFCFTLNNYTTQEEIMIQNFADASFIIYGHEVAPTTGTPHLQGYIEVTKKTTIKALCKKLPRCSFKVSKGTSDDNEDYCEKDGVGIFRKGTPMAQGERKDLKEVAQLILTGVLRVDSVVIDDPMLFHQYGRTLNKIEDLQMRRLFRKEMTTCTWYYGETGVGKSHKAYENYSPDTHYNWKDDNGWQDGYAQQETVIINEFRGQITYGNLLQLIDKWPYELKRRQREPMPFVSKNIIITSSVPPQEIYTKLSENDSLEQLMRRITLIKLLKDNVEEVQYAICQKASLQTPSEEGI